ncbi:MAG: GNAT family N-acetyltransferase [Planctomycetota bacterium]|nr:MAG: GNAT family N-acetyltransferase [Planctomycetota bacterium]
MVRLEPARVLALRARVLRPARPLEAARFAGDDDPRTLHLGVLGADGEPVAVATLLCEPLPDEAQRSECAGRGWWRLRGMAVEPALRGRGLGRRLLAVCEREAAARGAHAVWCNARRTAIGFYERCGWRCVSAPFEIPGIGPHRRMVREVAALGREDGAERAGSWAR